MVCGPLIRRIPMACLSTPNLGRIGGQNSEFYDVWCYFSTEWKESRQLAPIKVDSFEGFFSARDSRLGEKRCPWANSLNFKFSRLYTRRPRVQAISGKIHLAFIQTRFERLGTRLWIMKRSGICCFCYLQRYLIMCQCNLLGWWSNWGWPLWSRGTCRMIR